MLVSNDPRLHHPHHHHQQQQQQVLRIRSNLPLQMCLHFNLYLFPLWCWIEIYAHMFASEDKEILVQVPDSPAPKQRTQVYYFLSTSSLLLLFVVELIRLYTGYFGNQLEKVQHMLAFVFLSVCLQLPNHIYRQTVLLFGAAWRSNQQDSVTVMQSAHRAASIIATALLCIEIVAGCVHLRAIFQRIYYHCDEWVSPKNECHDDRRGSNGNNNNKNYKDNNNNNNNNNNDSDNDSDSDDRITSTSTTSTTATDRAINRRRKVR